MTTKQLLRASPRAFWNGSTNVIDFMSTFCLKTQWKIHIIQRKFLLSVCFSCALQMHTFPHDLAQMCWHGNIFEHLVGQMNLSGSSEHFILWMWWQGNVLLTWTEQVGQFSLHNPPHRWPHWSVLPQFFLHLKESWSSRVAKTRAHVTTLLI